MATIIEELVTKWSFKGDFGQLQAAQGFVQRFKSALTTTAISVTAFSATIGAFVYKTLLFADEVDKLSTSLGITTDSFQKLMHAAGLAGIEASAFSGALRALSLKMLEAQEGSEELVSKLRELGISSEFLRDKNIKLDQTLLVLADAFSKMPDGVRKTALASYFFGKAGTRMLNFFKEGSAGIRNLMREAEELGVVFSKEDVEAAVILKDELEKLESVSMSLVRTIAKAFIPGINKVVISLREWIVANRTIVSQRVDKIIKIISTQFNNFIKILKIVYQVFSSIVSLFGGLDVFLNLLTKSLFTLSSFKIIRGIGAISTALLGLSASSAGIIALGAAIAGIFLIVEDIVAYFQGRESLTAQVVEAILSLSNKIRAPLLGVYEIFNFVFGGIKNILNESIGFIKNSLETVSTFLSSLGEKAFSVFSQLKSFFIKTPEISQSINLVKEVAVAPKEIAKPQTNQVSNIIKNELNAPITINVPQGMSAEDVGNAVRRALDDVIKSTSRSLKPVVEY